MKKFFALTLTASVLTFSSQAMAAEVDMSQLKCSTVAGMPASRKMAIGMWMSGYVHGRAGNTMVDTKTIRDNAKRLGAYCSKNSGATVMSAIEKLGR